jgi:hypothetical protein
MQVIQGSDLIKDSRLVINANFAEIDSHAIVTYSATPAFNLAQGRTQKITLTGACAPTVIGQVAGVRYVFIIMQNTPGGHVFTWPAAFRGAMEVGQEPAMGSVQEFISDGTYLWATGPGIQNA